MSVKINELPEALNATFEHVFPAMVDESTQQLAVQQVYNLFIDELDLGSASDADATDFASAAQGLKADELPDPDTFVAGDMLYHNGTSLLRVPKGVDNTSLVMVSGVPTWVKTRFRSATGSAVSSAALITQAHGLYKKPHTVTLWAKCIATDGGYAVGEEIPVDYNTSSKDYNLYISLIADATNLKLRCSSSATYAFIAANATTGSGQLMLISKWEFYIEAFA